MIRNTSSLSAGSKVCCGCKLQLPIEAFCRNAAKRDGRNPTCKACLRSRRSARRVPKVHISLPPGSFGPLDVQTLSPPRGDWEMIVGEQFANLQFTGRVRRTDKQQLQAEMLCKCGTVRFFNCYHVRKAFVRSCGCAGNEKLRAETIVRNTSHGLAPRGNPHPLYNQWCNMRRRCFSSRDIGYANYGGRGITVCDRWRKSFACFVSDMGERPSKAHSLERLDNDGNYEPGNVVWATAAVQNLNSRHNAILEFRGQRKCITEWGRELGLTYSCIKNRLARYGWSVEEALSRPYDARFRRAG